MVVIQKKEFRVPLGTKMRSHSRRIMTLISKIAAP